MLNNCQPDGVHYLIEFFGCSGEQLDSIAFWKKLLKESVSDSNISVLNEEFYQFSPHGITGYLLLSASHISIHTWPEYSYVTCDIFSCGGEDDTKNIVEHIKDNLCHNKKRVRKIKRGFRYNPK